MMPTTAITRYELSQPFTEFDLMMNQKGFIGPRVLRPFPVALQSAEIGKIPLKQLLKRRNTKRAPHGGYGRHDFEFDKYSYSTDDFGWETPLDDRRVRIFRDMIDAEQIAADITANVVLEEYERDVAARVYDTGVWTGGSLTTALNNEWDDKTNATPIEDIRAAKEKVITGSGLVVNALILNSLQFDHLINTDQIVERVKYTARADYQTLKAAVADVLNIEEIIVAGEKGGALSNSANPQQAAVVARIWSSEYAMLARVAKTDDPQEPCIGRTFIWSGDGPGAAGTEEVLALIVEEYREEGVRGGVIRVRNDRGIEIMYPQAGHLLSNVLTL